MMSSSRRTDKRAIVLVVTILTSYGSLFPSTLASLAFGSYQTSPERLSAQPVPPASHELIPTTAAEALRRLRTAYRGGSIAERVTFTINDDAPEDAGRSVVVRVRSGASADFSDRCIRLELPDLVFFAVHDRAVAIRPSDPTGCIEWPSAGPPTPSLLASVLPPLALPQIALAFGEDGVSQPTPFGSVDAWEIKPVSSNTSGTLVRLVGVGPEATTELVFDAMTDRLTEFTIKPAAGQAGAIVRGRCESVAPGPVKSWAIGVEGRRKCRTFDELRVPPAELKVGDTLADLSVQDRVQNRWSLADNLANGRGVDVGLLLLFRPDPSGDGAITSDVKLGLRAMERCWRLAALQRAQRDESSANPEIPGIALARGVAVFELQAFTLERLERLHGSWGESTLAGGPQSPSSVRPPPDLSSLLWTPTGVSTLDRLAPDARVLLIVLGSDRKIRALVRLDGRSNDPASVDAELEAIFK